VLARADAEPEGLSPFYFVLVMATGIVAIAADLLGVRALAPRRSPC
jgi:hypothetical protein